MSVCDTCGLPMEICICEDIAKEQQQIRIVIDSRRYGKKMTIVEGIADASIDLDQLLSQLKTRCACGGTVKDGNIELQGDHSKKVRVVLESLGFQAIADS